MIFLVVGDLEILFSMVMPVRAHRSNPVKSPILLNAGPRAGQRVQKYFTLNLTRIRRRRRTDCHNGTKTQRETFV